MVWWIISMAMHNQSPQCTPSGNTSMKILSGQCLVYQRLFLTLSVSLTYCQVGWAVAGLQIARAFVLISLPLNTALGENRRKAKEESLEERRRTILGGSVATRQHVYHNSCCPQGKLGWIHQRLIHSPPLPSDKQPCRQAYAHSHNVLPSLYSKYRTYWK